MDNPVLVDVMRGGIVESAHRGSLAIVDERGDLVFALGDVMRPVFPRSAVKLLQALPLVSSGAADELGLSDEALALACASHGGEPRHVAAAASMLASAGVDEAALECGAHWPSHDASARALARAGQEPSALHNNCSGKHAGFICLAATLSGRRGDALRGFLGGYVRAEHPVMLEVTAALQVSTGWDVERGPRGIDGCSIPTYAIPLRHLAGAFARVATGIGLGPADARAARRLRQAIAAAPQQVAGTGRMDTRVMERLGERLCCKVGAEGVYCAALPERGWGVAVKMDDGNNARAVEAVMAAVAEACLTLDDGSVALLRAFSDVTLRNWRGTEVGVLRANATLRTALSRGVPHPA